jgi:hypothetical protein
MVEVSTENTHNANAVPQKIHQIYSLQLLLLGWLAVNRKDVKGSSHVQFEVLCQYFLQKLQKTTKPSVRIASSGLSFEPRTTQI